MNAQNSNHQIAMDLISQYGEDAESIARKRGKRLIDVNEVMRGNHQSIW